MSNVGNLGSCWSCVTDLTMPAKMASGFQVVGEAIARRWSTPRGGLIDDPNYGYDLTDSLSDDLDKAGLSRVANLAAAEALKDERVLTCAVTITLGASGVFLVTGKVGTGQGPFQLVVSVSQLSVTLLQVST